MGKRIVFCSDGTWDNSGSNTNVYKFFKALKTGAGQVPFYDDGVGADGSPIEKLIDGALGTGLFEKIKEGYTKIAHVYEKGDEIFLFGFSRGAYTARSIAGMIANCGLPTANFSEEAVETAFQSYREERRRTELLAQLNKSCGLFDAKVKMVGVWDTVGALGIPAIFGGVNPLIHGFLNAELHPGILNAYHALAIDERRSEFPATLWSQPDTPVPGQTVEQVWFSGVHSDVGGSYPNDPDGTALSHLTLAWMMDKASALGLEFAAGVRSRYALPMDPKYALDQQHESWNPLWLFPKRRQIPENSTIADTVFLRCEHDNSYRPQNLSFRDGTLASHYRKAMIVTQAAMADEGRRPPDSYASRNDMAA